MHSYEYTGVQPHPTCLHCTGVSQSSAADTVPVWVVKLRRAGHAGDVGTNQYITNRAACRHACCSIQSCSTGSPLFISPRASSHYPIVTQRSPNVVHLLQPKCLPAQLPNVVLPAPLAHVRGTRIACGGRVLRVG